MKLNLDSQFYKEDSEYGTGIAKGLGLPMPQEV
jgi:hypothetical protein